MTLGFVGNADFFMKFFELCMKYEIDDEKDRVRLLVELAKKEGNVSVFETQRTKEEVAEDCAKNYGKTLYIKEED